MEKGHPRYLTAVIKMPPETTSVGDVCGMAYTLIMSSPDLALSFAEMWYEIGHSIPG